MTQKFNSAKTKACYGVRSWIRTIQFIFSTSFLNISFNIPFPSRSSKLSFTNRLLHLIPFYNSYFPPLQRTYPVMVNTSVYCLTTLDELKRFSLCNMVQASFPILSKVKEERHQYRKKIPCDRCIEEVAHSKLNRMNKYPWLVSSNGFPLYVP
jgi:hypothetical protein